MGCLSGTRLGHSVTGTAMGPSEFKIALEGLDGLLLVLHIVGIEHAKREIDIDVIRIGR